MGACATNPCTCRLYQEVDRLCRRVTEKPFLERTRKTGTSKEKSVITSKLIITVRLMTVKGRSRVFSNQRDNA